MTMQEISTAVQYRLPIKIFILNNQYMGMVRQWQELLHGGRYSDTYSEALPDFVKLADAYHAPASAASNPAKLDEKIREMIEVKKPVIFDCVVDPTENCFPMIPSGRAHNEMLLGDARDPGRGCRHRGRQDAGLASQRSHNEKERAMKLAIIGAGNVGGTLGTAWAQKAGHEICFGVRDAKADKTQALLRKIGGKARAGTAAEAAAFGEMIVLTTPWPAAEAAIQSMGDLTGKIILDATNPLAMGPDGSASKSATAFRRARKCRVGPRAPSYSRR